MTLAHPGWFQNRDKQENWRVFPPEWLIVDLFTGDSPWQSGGAAWFPHQTTQNVRPKPCATLAFQCCKCLIYNDE